MKKHLDPALAPPAKTLEIIESYFERSYGPKYLGFIALEVGWSLERTQEMLDTLELRGVVRQVSLDEKKRLGYPTRAVLYALSK